MNNCEVDIAGSALKQLKLDSDDSDIERLNISGYKCTVTQVIQALSESKNIKFLDISKNFSDCEKVNDLAIALNNYPLLQKINISNNLLTFNSVLMVVQALRSHPNLQILNISGNITSYFLECEFLTCYSIS